MLPEASFIVCLKYRLREREGMWLLEKTVSCIVLHFIIIENRRGQRRRGKKELKIEGRGKNVLVRPGDVIESSSMSAPVFVCVTFQLISFSPSRQKTKSKCCRSVFGVNYNECLPNIWATKQFENWPSRVKVFFLLLLLFLPLHSLSLKSLSNLSEVNAESLVASSQMFISMMPHTNFLLLSYFHPKVRKKNILFHVPVINKREREQTS